ncbi:serine/threonine-protein phosphatase 6 regulatory subunit 3-A isoform X2 [Ischnura elegans]|uniref:serine/threonine-protein phosphatase 6 regulatory subunit 3-A isoform X2 n=1 Tax=Ischnura elegans TaxID=197161 RepID=UPI001ED8B7A3|nr:serine/threonine-protein phosphatase 6 regulatory subunit 3-A isoform X2 [Ischnura elegans]
MFWKYSHQSYPQQIDYLLDKKDVTLRELLDEEDVLQECRAQNKKLIEFLIRPEIMEELVTLTTVEPTSGSDGDGSCDTPDEFKLYKHPNTACELLACDIPTLNERLAGDEALMARLYSFLETEPPLNPLLASFFARTLGVLLTRNSEQNWYSYQLTCLQVLEFLKSREDFITLLLRHMGTSAIMDLMFKLFTSVEGDEIKLNLLNWLNGQQVIQRLVSLFHPSIDSERHSNTAYLLCNIISKYRDNVSQTDSYVRASPPSSANIILNAIESPQTVSNLLELMLSNGPNGEQSESAIVGGILVLLEILDYNPHSRENGYGGCGVGLGQGSREGESLAAVEEHKRVVAGVVKAVIPFLPRIHSLLVDPPPNGAVRTTAEVLTVPLGSTRLHVAKLICALISVHSPAVDECLIKLNTINVLLDLFFKYSWNNFLHTQVEQAISLALDIPKSDNENRRTPEAGDWGNELGRAPDTRVSPLQSDDDATVLPSAVEEDMHEGSDAKGQQTATTEEKGCKEDEPSLVQHIFSQCNIVQRILNAWEENKEEQAKPNGRRRGYMGHLIKIANNVVKVTMSSSDEESQESVIAPMAATDINCEKDGTSKSPLAASSPTSSPSPPTSPPGSPVLPTQPKPTFVPILRSPMLDDATSEKWNAFVNSFLAQANATNNVLLGGEHPSHASPASDEALYGGSQMRQESVLQQVQQTYNQFQIQQIATIFSENFHDEEFTDEDDTQQRTELFKQLCAEKVHASSSCSSLDGSDPEEEEEEDDDEDHHDTFDRPANRRSFVHPVDYSSRTRNQGGGGEDGKGGGGSSSDEDDDNEEEGGGRRKGEVQMEVDSTDPWAALDPSSSLGLAPVAMDEAPNPWGDSTAAISSTSPLASIAPTALIATPDDSAVGWADFESASGLGSFANFEANFGIAGDQDEPGNAKDENKNVEESTEEGIHLSTTTTTGGHEESALAASMQSQRVPGSAETEMAPPAAGDFTPKVEEVKEHITTSECDSAMSDERFLFFPVFNTGAAVDASEVNLAHNSKDTMLESSPVPCLPGQMAASESLQPAEKKTKDVGAIVAQSPALCEPLTESPANGPV